MGRSLTNPEKAKCGTDCLPRQREPKIFRHTVGSRNSIVRTSIHYAEEPYINKAQPRSHFGNSCRAVNLLFRIKNHPNVGLLPMFTMLTQLLPGFTVSSLPSVFVNLKPFLALPLLHLIGVEVPFTQ